MLMEKMLQIYAVSALMSTIVLLCIVKNTNSASSMHIMILIGFGVFIYSPAVLNGFFFDTSFQLYFVTSFLVLLLLRKTEKCVDKLFEIKNTFFQILLIIYAGAFCLILMLDLKITIEYILGPLVLLLALSLRRGKNIENAIYATFLFGLLFYFIIFEWEGFGRVVIFGNLIVGLIILMRVYEIHVRKTLFLVLTILGSLMMASRDAIKADSLLTLAFLDDSAVGPYRLAVTFIDRYFYYGIDLQGFFGQVIFTFLSFVPREIWPSKPYGFGFLYVLENMDQSLVLAGHSIASTFIGDHFYFLGFWGLVSAYIMVMIISKIINIVYRSNILCGSLYVLLSCNMMVLIWGGMTSFSARIIFPIIGAIPLIILFHLLANYRNSLIKSQKLLA